MSDGLARAAGGGVPIEFDGVMVVLPPMTLRDLATIEQYMLSQRPNPLEVVKEHLDGMDSEAKKQLLEMAYRDLKNSTTINPEDMMVFLCRLEGIVMCYWLCLEKSYPGRWTHDRVREIFMDMTDEQLGYYMRVRDQASGMDDLGNSTGQDTDAAKPSLASLNDIAAAPASGGE